MEEKEAQRRKRARSKSRQRKEAQLESKGQDSKINLLLKDLRPYKRAHRSNCRFYFLNNTQIPNMTSKFEISNYS